MASIRRLSASSRAGLSGTAQPARPVFASNKHTAVTFTQQCPALAAVAKARGYESPMWVSLPNRASVADITAPGHPATHLVATASKLHRRRRYCHLSAFPLWHSKLKRIVAGLEPQTEPHDAFTKAPFPPEIAQALAQRQEELGHMTGKSAAVKGGGWWVPWHMRVGNSLPFTADVTSRHVANIPWVSTALCVNCDLVSPKVLDALWSTPLTASSLNPVSKFFHVDIDREVHGTPLVFTSTCLQERGLQLKASATPLRAVWVQSSLLPLDDIVNGEDVAAAFGCDKTALPTLLRKRKGIDVVSGAVVALGDVASDDMRPDCPSLLPPSCDLWISTRAVGKPLTTPGGTLITPVLQDNALPRFLTSDVPAPCEYYSVDDLVDPDEGFRAAGTFASADPAVIA